MGPRRLTGRRREVGMAWAFAIGSTCFVVGPFPGYLDLVGPAADAVTFFVGSVFFTVGGALQTWLAVPGRRRPGSGRAAWWAAAVQLLGTLFFNVTTLRALHTAITSPRYDALVWRPDAFGSVCFLVSGVIAYRASARHGWLPLRGTSGWWQPGVNLLGCLFFGVAAVAGYVVPGSGSSLGPTIVNTTTCAGAICFLACAVEGLRTGGGRRVVVHAGGRHPVRTAEATGTGSPAQRRDGSGATGGPGRTPPGSPPARR